MSPCCRWRRRGELKKCGLRSGAESHHSLAHRSSGGEAEPVSRIPLDSPRGGLTVRPVDSPKGEVSEPLREVLDQVGTESHFVDEGSGRWRIAGREIAQNQQALHALESTDQAQPSQLAKRWPSPWLGSGRGVGSAH